MRRYAAFLCCSTVEAAAVNVEAWNQDDRETRCDVLDESRGRSVAPRSGESRLPFWPGQMGPRKADLIRHDEAANRVLVDIEMRTGIAPQFAERCPIGDPAAQVRGRLRIALGVGSR